MEIKYPVVDIIKQYFEKFKGQEGYFLSDDKALNFFKTHPDSTDPRDILLKIEEVRDNDLSEDEAQDSMVAHIQSLNVDSLISKADAQIVNDIARVQHRGVGKNYYAFASRYCNYHNPYVYPIYDSLLDTILQLYFERRPESRLSSNEMHDYLKFKPMMQEYLQAFQLPVVNFRELDKFLWVYGRNVIVDYRKLNQLSEDPDNDPDLNF